MSHHSRATLGVGLVLLIACVRASAPAGGDAAANATKSSTASRSLAALPRPSEVPIRTNRTRYALNDSGGIARFTIPFRYRNETGRTVYLPTCRGAQPPRLQKKVGDRWIVAFAPVVAFCMGVPVAIGAGETFNYTMQITAGMPGTSFMPRFSVSDVPGTYRILWEVFGGVEGDARQPSPVKDLLPIEWRISNDFELVR
jgi:hypothetical protein